MRQLIRNKVFETNSSSTHSLAILKNDNLTTYDIEANIPIMESFYGYTNDPETLLSYIYTIALISHDWALLSKIKKEFINCIFQKPRWDLPYESETGFCDDIEVISFCDLLDTTMLCHFGHDDRKTILIHLREFIFKGELYIAQDSDYKDCILTYHHIQDDHTLIKDWIDKNVEILLED